MQFVLDIKNNNKQRVWLFITIFCIVFSTIYEHFSFGVYSNSMIFMFLYPLLLGLLPCIITKLNFSRLWNEGVIALTLASLLNGVLEIYGTDSNYIKILLYLGVVMLIVETIRLFVVKKLLFHND